MELNIAFGQVLRDIRKQRGLTQEDFSDVSSRTYLSTLERGLKCPTIDKITQLAEVLRVHPATLITAAFLAQERAVARKELLQQIDTELKDLGML
ncbi:helix-turn-helix transcriptional regulator [Pseudomonas amygdali]|uniref:helix-turn-helix domain-containing protein n=1 Tax=Pseudomonas amygdali TaxID=47877 RepID=UPI0006B9BF5B|nr:helix-turn-helix transcriptional regulator [Pseudomonas amygdali]PPS27359.1 transcriptional regulator [Pseudomonas amygdali pv. morsprunorum]RMN53882.1 Transcriptional regulator, PbsX family [Pseudomonas amygdali pv. hibisci]UBT81274.1 helix-turn-helix transcriptional regulator [Pseudomonas amygdali]